MLRDKHKAESQKIIEMPDSAKSTATSNNKKKSHDIQGINNDSIPPRPLLSFTTSPQGVRSTLTTVSDDSQTTVRTKTTSQRTLISIDEQSSDATHENQEDTDEDGEEEEESDSEDEVETDTDDDYQNEENFTGLHKLCYNAEGEEDPLWDRVVDYLLALGPSEAVEAVTLEQKGVIPLFIACERQPSVKAVNALIDAFPKTLEFTDEQDFRPLHIACSHDANEDIIQIMVEKDPSPKRAKEALTGAHATPLHLIMYENNLKLPSLSLFRTLMTPSVMEVKDQYGNTPAELLIQYIERLNELEGDNLVFAETNCVPILGAYLDLTPHNAFYHLDKMKNFPPQIYRHILHHTYVQQIINKRISSQFSTFTLSLELLFQIIIIASFTQVISSSLAASNETDTGIAKPSYVNDTYLIMITVGISYHLVRTLHRFFFTSSSFAFFGDFWNLITVYQIFFVIVSLILLWKGGSRFTESWQNLLHQLVFTITGGIIWIPLISIFRVLFLPFSVFVTILSNMMYIVFPLVSIIFCIIGAFSLMLFTLVHTSENGKNMCSQQDRFGDLDIDADFLFCTLGGSFFHVYNMFVGDKELSQFMGERALILPPVFAFLVVVLFLNIMIATAIHSYAQIERKGEEFFWNLRLTFIMESEYFMGLVGNKLFRIYCRKPSVVEENHKVEDDDSKESDLHVSKQDFYKSIASASKGSYRLMWDILTNAISQDTGSREWNAKERKLYDSSNKIVHRKILEVPLFTRRLLALFVLPMWLLIGLLTLGLFWPPQIREFILWAPLSKTANRINRDKMGEDQAMRETMKQMNHRIQIMENEMRSLKKDVGAMHTQVIADTGVIKNVLMTLTSNPNALYAPYTTQSSQTPHNSPFVPQSPYQYFPYISTPISSRKTLSLDNSNRPPPPPFQG